MESNLEFLKQFTGGDSKRMDKYIRIYLDSSPAEIALINKNLSEKNWDAIRAIAHSLKPQMTYMGIKKGEELLKTIETNAGGQVNLEQIPSFINELNTICSVAADELNEHLINLKIS